MIRTIRLFINYLYPPADYKRPPKQTINDYKIMLADEQERLLMTLNLARSPETARDLLNKYGVDNASDLLEIMPVTERTITAKTRLKQLIRNMAGHKPGDPYRCWMDTDEI